jgi:hypothetical protein
VGRALKDDDKGGECVFVGKKRKVDCRVTLFLAMTLAERERFLRGKKKCIESTKEIRIPVPESSGQASLAQG